MPIDGSGSFVKRVPIYTKNSSEPIFLYILVVRFGGTIYPVMQVLSSVHHTNAIARWLKLHKKITGVQPSVIVEDRASTLLCATSLAYNGHTFTSFSTHSLRILRGESLPLAPCLIKRDIAHLVNNVVKWGFFDNWDMRARDFHARCIGYSFKIEKLDHLLQVVRSMLIICQSSSREEGSECLKETKKNAEFIRIIRL